jgi:hypothetical protein
MSLPFTDVQLSRSFHILELILAVQLIFLGFYSLKKCSHGDPFLETKQEPSTQQTIEISV